MEQTISWGWDDQIFNELAILRVHLIPSMVWRDAVNSLAWTIQMCVDHGLTMLQTHFGLWMDFNHTLALWNTVYNGRVPLKWERTMMDTDGYSILGLIGPACPTFWFWSMPLV